MRPSLGFFARFVLVSSLLYGAFSALAQLYLAAVVPAANFLYLAQHLPVRLEQRGALLLLTYGGSGSSLLRLQALDYHVVYLNLVAALSLVLAAPGPPLWSRFRWCSVLAVTLWISHVATFYAGAYIALWDYLNGIPDAAVRDRLSTMYAAQLPAATADAWRRAVELWNLWGRYGVVLAAWLASQRAWVRPASRTAPESVAIPLRPARARMLLSPRVPSEGRRGLGLNPVT